MKKLVDADVEVIVRMRYRVTGMPRSVVNNSDKLLALLHNDELEVMDTEVYEIQKVIGCFPF